ncbi:hypothetical protein PFTANZ_00275 [Plasmodium falciparum Tanzania (2000708)]|nr:hypothetical protein PFTANZ_00275 [Plasmodium falciparum Tanzania (2000708)]ETW51668.1 hypothetical protein PFMALIP_00248 [Plasmodium falciparum MaliPS096_E11]
MDEKKEVEKEYHIYDNNNNNDNNNDNNNNSHTLAFQNRTQGETTFTNINNITNDICEKGNKYTSNVNNINNINEMTCKESVEVNEIIQKTNKRKFHNIELKEHYCYDLFKKRKLENTYRNTYKKNRKIIINCLLTNKNIFQYKEHDIVNKVKQIFIKAKHMATNGDLRNRWKSREDVKKILLL